jgi:isopenicillin-N epimerase
VKEKFLLNPDIAYLNHGSFGACPRPVFEAYQRYQLELEREPVDFLQRHFCEKMHSARAKLAGFLGCGSDDLAFVRNTTYGLNVVARSLSLQQGDVILTTDHEYGAVDRMWHLVAQEVGAKVIRVRIPLPVTSPGQIVRLFQQHLDSSVKVMAIPHLSAETTIRFPVEELITLAREEGIISAIDGAHAPGQLPINLSELGADFYVGNCHKWLLSPKGAGFVYAAPHQADMVRSPIIGWGNISQGSTALLLENEWQGTSDTSAFLAVVDAIDFLESHHWFETVVPNCERRLTSASPELLQLTGQSALCENKSLRCPQMSSFQLPPGDHSHLHATLFEEHQIEIPVFSNAHGDFFRVSVQAYNSDEDLQRLIDALRAIL